MTTPLRLAPDGARYLIAGRGHPVARPFNLRWLLPAVCGDDVQLWWLAWALSWPCAAAGAAWWAYGMGVTGWPLLAVPALLLGLAGIWGDPRTRPMQVDLPSMAVGLLAAGAFVNGVWFLGVVLVIIGALIKESTPVWVALWCWSPLPLVGLAAVAVVARFNRPGMDDVTSMPELRTIHDHPVKTAWMFQSTVMGGWRDGWSMVAPWGATLAALVQPTWQLVATLAVAYAQLFVATDRVRLVTFAAGPVMALAAVSVIPVQWLLLAVVVHIVWWREQEFI